MTEAKTICGHERETLKWALGFALKFGNDSPMYHDVWSSASHYEHEAICDACDPAKLTDIIAALLRERGFGVLVFRRYIFGQGAPRAQFVILWERDEPWLDIWNGSKWRDYIDLPKVRTLALRLLETNTTTALDIGRMIGEV